MSALKTILKAECWLQLIDKICLFCLVEDLGRVIVIKGNLISRKGAKSWILFFHFYNISVCMCVIHMYACLRMCRDTCGGIHGGT